MKFELIDLKTNLEDVRVQPGPASDQTYLLVERQKKEKK